MGIEEEGIREFDFVVVLGVDGSCNAVEDSVVGPRDDLDCDGIFGSRG